MKRNVKVISAMLAGAMTLTMLGGCGGKKNNEASGQLTYWKEPSAATSVSVSNYGDTPFAKKLQEQTGIKVDYQHPTQGQAAE